MMYELHFNCPEVFRITNSFLCDIAMMQLLHWRWELANPASWYIFCNLIIRMMIGPVSHLILGKKGHKAMIPIKRMEDYLVDKGDGP